MRQLQYYFKNTILISSLLIGIAGCNKNNGSDDETIGNWVKSSDFDGYARGEAVIFTIGDKAYVSTGNTDRERLKDLWEYDLEQKYWSQKADMVDDLTKESARARNLAVGFAIGNKGYVGTGYDGDERLKDFWQYDAATNTWARKKDFGGTARQDAVAFAIGDKGYISCGYDGNYLKDLWEYDPSADSWTQRASLGGSKRSEAMSFVIDNKAYIASGTNNGTTLNDIWMYEPASNKWTEKRKISNISDESYDDDYTSIQRSNGVAFVLGGFAYITTGNSTSLNNDTWEYHPADDTWIKRTAFEKSGRVGALAFSLKNRAFVLTGRSGSTSFDDMHEFFPTAEYESND